MLNKYLKFILESADFIDNKPGKTPFNNDEDDDYNYLNNLFKMNQPENIDDGKLKEGDRITYHKDGSEHDGKSGVFTGIREDGKYSIVFNDGKKLAAISKNIHKDIVRNKIG